MSLLFHDVDSASASVHFGVDLLYIAGVLDFIYNVGNAATYLRIICIWNLYIQ